MFSEIFMLVFMTYVDSAVVNLGVFLRVLEKYSDGLSDDSPGF
jgi:hypothetical protein